MEMPTAIKRYIEAFNAGDLDKLIAQFTPTAIIHGVLGSFRVQEVVPIWREFHEQLAMELVPEAVVADEVSAAVRYTERGCFRGPCRAYAGHQPTNRPYAITAMEWFELNDGKIQQRWGARDSASISKQILP